MLNPSGKDISSVDLHRRAQKIAGEFYLGTWNDAHEYGGICYWPRSYFNYLTDELKPGESREKYSPLVSHYKNIMGAMNVKQGYVAIQGYSVFELNADESQCPRRLGCHLATGFGDIRMA